MEQDIPLDRLSRLATPWTIMFLAHGKEAASVDVRAARGHLLQHYEPVMRRYLRVLLGTTSNREEAVEDCMQELALRFLTGAFERADPKKGRFRDYLKTCLRNQSWSYLRRAQGQAKPLGEMEPAAEAPLSAEEDQEFVHLWRNQLVADTLQALDEHERKTGKPLATVLRLRMNFPQMHSPEMAETLSVKLEKKVDAAWVRKNLFRAREKFADLLLQEVQHSLSTPSAEAVEEELVELGLMEYCKDILDRRKASPKT